MPVSSLKIVLIRPRDPNNIGAAARAMKNFGLSSLAVVAPFTPTWNEVVSAVNAEDVLKQADVFATIEEAVADCTFVVGTADRSRVRDKHRPYTPQDLHTELAATAHRLALVFGSEKHGLTNDDLAHCHRTLSLPTALECPSMNLGQAVAICCYEFSRLAISTDKVNTRRNHATAGEIETSLQLLAAVLRESRFVSPTTEAATITKMRQQLLRLGLTRADANLLCGVLRQIQWRFENK